MTSGIIGLLAASVLCYLYGNLTVAAVFATGAIILIGIKIEMAEHSE